MGSTFQGDHIELLSIVPLGLHPRLSLLLIREVLVVESYWNCVLEAGRVGGAHLVTGATGEGSQGSLVSGYAQGR